MILDDNTIQKLELIGENYEPRNLQAASYDLSLDIPAGSVDAADKECLVLPIGPGDSVLLSTKEVIKLPNNIGATIKDKSSFMRAGLMVVQGWVDPGFIGTLTVRMTNVGTKPFWLKQGQPFCQIVFEEIKQAVSNSYDGHYQNQCGIKKSVFEESDESVACVYGELND